MGDERDQPSLELPKLRLGRRKDSGGRRRRGRGDGGEQATVPAPETVADTPPAAPFEPAPGGGGFGSVSTAETEVESPPAVVPETPIPVRPRRPGGMVAVVVVGLAVGLGIVGLTWASLQGCERVQGTSSCGGAGYPLLAAILVVMVVVGSLLLRLARVAEPGATSFLAVGLASVLALLLLVDHLTDRSMIVVVPLLTAACYALAHWVTRTFVDAPTD